MLKQYLQQREKMGYPAALGNYLRSSRKGNLGVWKVIYLLLMQVYTCMRFQNYCFFQAQVLGIEGE